MSDGSFSFEAGHLDPRDAIALDDVIDLQVVDPVSRAVIAILELTPFTAEDGRAFVALPNRTTTFTSADDLTVTVPSGAFDTPTVIAVAPSQPAAFAGVPNFGDELRYATSVDLRFDGIAKERIDVSLPIPPNTDTNRDFLLGYLGASMRGPRVMIVDLLRVDGARFVTATATSTNNARRVATNAAVTGPALRNLLLGVNRSGIYAAVDLHVASGAVGWGVMSGLQAGYDLFWDSLASLYADHFYLAEGRGRIAIPVVQGKQFQIVGVDAGTGLEAFAKVYDPIPIGDPGAAAILPNANPDRVGPYPVFATPFRVETMEVSVADVALTSIDDFTITLHNARITAITTLADDVQVTLLNATRGLVDSIRGDGLSVDGDEGDRIVLLVEQRDVDPYTPLSLVFDEPIDTTDLQSLVRLETAAEGAKQWAAINGALRIRTDSGDRRLLIETPASLTRGNRYRLVLSPELRNTTGLRIGEIADENGTPGGALAEPLYLGFRVRTPGGVRAQFDLQSGVIRDQALHGNVLFVAAGEGGIAAYDVSNPAAMSATTKPLRVASGATDYWSVATDHHGRVFATGVTPLLGVFQSFRLEQFLPELTPDLSNIEPFAGAMVSFTPGASSGLGTSTSLIAGDRAEGYPRRMQLLLQDDTLDADDVEELKQFNAVAVVASNANVFTFDVARDNANAYARQRITIENVTLDLRWSGDATATKPARIANVVARPGDRLRLIRNRTTYAVIALFGYGIAVHDVNAMESNDAPEKPANYQVMREQVRLTNAQWEPWCNAPANAIPDLTFTPDATVITQPGSTDLRVLALDASRGLLDVTIHPPHTAAEGKLPADRPLDCEDRGAGLLFRHRRADFSVYDDPRLAKLRALFKQHANREPFARFTGAARYHWTLEAADNTLGSPAANDQPALGQRGSVPNTRVERDYLLIPGNEYGLLVVEVAGAAPPLLAPSYQPLDAIHLVDIIWIPGGAYAVRTMPRGKLATVVDGEGHVLLVDLSRLDERWNAQGPIASDALFPTVASLLAKSIAVPDPRIVWRSAEPLTSGTLAPVVDADTGFVYAGRMLEKTTSVVAAVDPRIQLKVDTGAANGLSETGGLVPLGIAPPTSVPLRGDNASLAAFRLEVALPGAIPQLQLQLDSERVAGAKTEAMPAGWPQSSMRVTLQRAAGDDPKLRYQRGYNKWISPWIVAVADPRASESYVWPQNADRAAEGCFACQRPSSLRGKAGVPELFTNGRLLSIHADPSTFANGYAYLASAERLSLRVATVMADTVRAPSVLVAAQQPPVADGALQETTYLHSGELESSNLDLDAGGRAGWNVAFDRTYRSRTIGGTAMGEGWDATIFRRLRALPNGDVEYRDGAGELWLFRLDAAQGTYLRPAGLFLRLARANRGWTLTDQQVRVTTFDEMGRLASEGDEFANVVRYLYDPAGRLARIIDPVGRASSLAYDANGRLKTITDWRGRIVEYVHDLRGRLTAVKLPRVDNATPTTTYAYETTSNAFNDSVELAANLKSITDPIGGTPRVSFTYGARDKVTRQDWTATGESATFTYNADGSVTTRDALLQRRDYASFTPQPSTYFNDRAHVVRVDEVDVPTATFDFGKLPDTLSATAPRAPKTRSFTFDYDGEGLVHSSTLAGVATTTNVWQSTEPRAPGFVLQSTTTGGVTRTFAYTDGTFVKSVTASEQNAPSQTRNFAALHGRRRTDTAANDTNATVSVDAFGRARTSTSEGGTDDRSEGAAASFDYHPDDGPLHARGMLAAIDRGGLKSKIAVEPSRIITTDERNVETTTELDEWLRPKNVRTTSPGLAIDESVAYDANGRVTARQRKQAKLGVVAQHFEYDALGRTTRAYTNDTIDVDEHLTSVETKTDYSVVGRIKRTLPGGAIVTDILDGLGRVQTRITETGSSDIREEFAYDLAGNLVFSADNHVATASAYDVVGRETATLYADGTRTATKYDAGGNPTLVQQLDATANVVSESTPSFTSNGRLQSISTKVDDTRQRQTTMRWDGAGRVTSVATAGRATTQLFDRAGRLKSATTPLTSFTATSYDGALVSGAAMTERGSAAVEAQYEFDAQANVTREQVGPLAWRSNFDEAGNVIAHAPPQRKTSAFDYDARGNLTREVMPDAARIQHGYHPSGSGSSYRDPIDETTKATQIDRIGRPLVRTYPDNTTEVFTYDGARVATYKDRQGRLSSYEYNEKGQLARIRSNTTTIEEFEYDDAGRLARWRTADAELVYENYDLEGRPRRTRQRRYADRSGFGARTLLDDYTQDHTWNLLGERESWTMPSFDGMQAPGWTARVSELHDAEGNVNAISRTLFGASDAMPLLTARYRSSGRPDERTLTTAGGAAVTRSYAYDAKTSQLIDLTVASRGLVLAGSRVEYDGTQIARATLHGLSGEARANEYTYDDQSRLASSRIAAEKGSAVAFEHVNAAGFREALERPQDEPGALPSLGFARRPGHKIATFTRGDVTRTFSYADGAERIDDGRFVYVFDARGRLISATEKPHADANVPRRRFQYFYSASDRVVGRRAERSTPSGEFVLEDRAAILDADVLPADTTFVWDPITDRVAAIFSADRKLLRPFIHGGNAYDDPIEVAIADGTAVRHLYPIFDEAATGNLQVILNTSGEIISRTVIDGPYGEDELTLAGPAIDRVAVAATTNTDGTLTKVEVTLRLTEAIAPATVPNGAVLNAVDAAGTVLRSAPATPQLFENHTLRWTLTPAEWQTLTSGAKSISIAATNTLRAAAWPADTPILPPVDSRDFRESVAQLSEWMGSLPHGTTRESVVFTAPAASALATAPASAARVISVAGFQALPFHEPATGLVFARNRWYDPTSGSFLSPDPIGYEDSSNLYAYCGGDPVNRRDPTGEDAYDDKYAAYLRWYGAQVDALWQQRKVLGEQIRRARSTTADTGALEAEDRILALRMMTFGGMSDKAILFFDRARAKGNARVLSMSFEDIHAEIVGDEAVAGVGAAVVGAFMPHAPTARQSLQRGVRRATAAYNSSVLSSEVGAVAADLKNLPRINGRRPINSRYAGENYPVERLPGELAQKYPNGVAFNEEGFAVFTPYAKARVKVNGLTGQYVVDEALANQAVGLRSTPSGYVWHHVEDGVTMELIPADIHGAVRHTGGAAKLRAPK